MQNIVCKNVSIGFGDCPRLPPLQLDYSIPVRAYLFPDKTIEFLLFYINAEIHAKIVQCYRCHHTMLHKLGVTMKSVSVTELPFHLQPTNGLLHYLSHVT